MIEAGEGYVRVEGSGIDVLTDFSAIAASLKENGIPEKLIIATVALGMSTEGLVVHDDKLFDDLMKEVKKRNAQKNKGTTDSD